ncbi:MAG: ABC transporter transmembrane domain-containing protein, partial [Pseudomonadota bacterium]
MLSWFEKRIDPFPPERPTQPPASLGAFLWHYTKPVWPFLALTSVLIATISGLQVMLFAFLGNIVDWLSAADPATFFAEEATGLFWMGFVVVVLIPILSFIHTMLMHQTLFGNYPMTMRWKAHRYMLGQSFGFYQDEFAGRVATKVMQTSLSVRETVVKLVDVFIYVGVYFLGTLILVTTLDWMLAIPFIVWLAFYVGTLWYFLPKMRVISERQSDARSIMTGRIVDSYTNIQTVKLFAHSNREEDYARDSMDQFLQTVHPQMRLVTWMNTCVDTSSSVL